MKRLLSFLFILCVIDAACQYDHLKFENKQIFYDKVFQVDSLNSNRVEHLLTLNLPKARHITDFNKVGDVITAKIEGAQVDYKKYGGTVWKTATYLNDPLFANVTVVWKDNKYRVTITNIETRSTSPKSVSQVSVMLLNKNGNDFDKRNIAIQSGVYLEKYLTELFTIKDSSNEW